MSDVEHAGHADGMAALDKNEPGNDAGEHEANNGGSGSPASSKNLPKSSRSKSPIANTMAGRQDRDREDGGDANNKCVSAHQPRSHSIRYQFHLIVAIIVLSTSHAIY